MPSDGADHDPAAQIELLELRREIYERVRRESELVRELDLHRESAAVAADLLRRSTREIEHLREELATARSEAGRSGRVREAFLTNVSHELRTPLTAILGFSQVLLDDHPNDESDTRILRLRSVRDNGQHLLRVLDAILDLSQLESGQIERRITSVSPLDLVRSLESVIRPGAEQKGLVFEVEYATGIPSRIDTDETRLRQVLLTLLENAVKFTESGGVKLGVALDIASRTCRLVFRVSDTGRGLPPEALASVFQAFRGDHPQTATPEAGLGLGLPVAKRIADVLDGDLDVESTGRNGSVFRLALDIGSMGRFEVFDPAESDAEAVNTIIDSSTRTYLDGVRLRGIAAHVLVVDDSTDNQRLICAVLHRAGLHTTCADHGEQGVEIALAARAAGEPFDMILMDLQMPVMDGFEATRTLRLAEWSGPIIAVTAHTTGREHQMALEAGCDDLAQKPIQRRAFVSQILEQLKGGPDAA